MRPTVSCRLHAMHHPHWLPYGAYLGSLPARLANVVRVQLFLQSDNDDTGQANFVQNRVASSSAADRRCTHALHAPLATCH